MITLGKKSLKKLMLKSNEGNKNMLEMSKKLMQTKKKREPIPIMFLFPLLDLNITFFVTCLAREEIE